MSSLICTECFSGVYFLSTLSARQATQIILPTQEDVHHGCSLQCDLMKIREEGGIKIAVTDYLSWRDYLQTTEA